MSAVLCDLVIDWVMRKTTGDAARGIRWNLFFFSTLDDLDFADHLALTAIAYTPPYTTKDYLFGQQVGLQISSKKTETLGFNVDKPVPVKVNGVDLSQTDEFTYPRTIIRPGGSAEGDIHNRIGEARTVFKSMNARNVFKSMNGRNVFKSMNARNVFKSMNARNVFKSMNARTVFKSMNARNVFKSMNARNVFKSMNARNVFKSMNARNVFKSMNARNVFKSMNNVRRSLQYGPNTKLKLYQGCVVSTILYGYQCWRMTLTKLIKLRSFHSTCLLPNC